MIDRDEERVSPRAASRFPFLEASGFSVPALLGIFLLLMLVVFSRRPQDLLHAQFYAEDGTRWFAQAYNLSWLTSLSIPDASYLQVLPRLAAGAALWIPLRFAPLLMNIFGAVVQVAPVIALLSRRCSTWGSLPVRIALSIIYIAIPNAPEIHINVTNAQWHLALLMTLLAFAESPEKLWQKALDVCLFLIGAFSGPFCIALLPVTLLYWLFKRHTWTLVLAACLAIGAGFQAYTIASAASYTPPAGADAPLVSVRVQANQVPLGATPWRFVRIVGGDMLFNSIVGSVDPRKLPAVTPVIGLVLGAVILVFGLRNGPLGLRLFALETVILLTAALHSPVATAPGLTRWETLIIVPGMRYYFFPSLICIWCALYCVTQDKQKWLRAFGYSVLFVFTLGVARHWEYKRFNDYNFDDSVNRVARARPGEAVEFRIPPDTWTMILVKRK